MHYRFGLYEFDSATRELLRSGTRVPLEAQPARALQYLLERRGAIATKEDLREAIWGKETHVDFERGIAYCLSEVRSALQDSAANPRFLQTIPRQGYRFIAPIEVIGPNRRLRLVAIGATAAALAGLWTAVNKRSQFTIGVSIFDNETGRSDLDRWVAGLSDVVLARLAGLQPDRLRVIGNAAALRHSRNIRRLDVIAREIDADHLILGQLQNQDSGLRFVTHLIRLGDGVHLKAKRILGSVAAIEEFERAILTEFEVAVRKHLLQQPE